MLLDEGVSGSLGDDGAVAAAVAGPDAAATAIAVTVPVNVCSGKARVRNSTG